MSADQKILGTYPPGKRVHLPSSQWIQPWILPGMQGRVTYRSHGFSRRYLKALEPLALKKTTTKKLVTYSYSLQISIYIIYIYIHICVLHILCIVFKMLKCRCIWYVYKHMYLYMHRICELSLCRALYGMFQFFQQHRGTQPVYAGSAFSPWRESHEVRKAPPFSKKWSSKTWKYNLVQQLFYAPELRLTW